MLELKIKTPTIKIPTKLLTKQIMTKAGITVANNYKQRIIHGKGVSPAGNVIKLQKLSDITKTNKGSNIPLVDTGRMKDAFRVDPVSTTTRKAVMNFPTSEAWKAGIHQKGITIKPRKKGGRLAVPFGDKTLFLKKVTIPARPHVGFSRKDIKDAMKMIKHYTIDRIKNGIKIEKPR